jgi:hypothetical protein
MLGVSFTGQNIKNALSTVMLQTASGDYMATRMHIVVVSRQLVGIDDSVLTIFE